MFMYEKNSAVTTVNAARQKLFSQQCKAINTYLHRAPRLPSPSARGWTKDNHGSHYGQHFIRLRTRTTSRCTVVANKTVKQDTSVQLPTSHVLPYATLEETAMQTSLMTAFEYSSRFCVSCCNFISVHVMNLLSPVGTLDCDF